MQLPLVSTLAILAMAAAPGSQAAVDLSCDCRMWHLMDTSVTLHCTRGKLLQDGATMISCQDAKVSDTPRGYHYVPGYALIRLSRIFKTWDAAKKTCEDEGAQLAVPPDRYAYDGLRQIFSRVKGVWYANIGITDRVSEGVFVDIKGRPVSDIPWQPLQPDNYGDNEDCVDFNIVGLSNDVYCENPAPFFCERRLTVGIPDTYVWLDDASRFYKVHEEKYAYWEAAKMCRFENATLAVVDTWRRGEALLTLLEPKNEFYLTGFTDGAVEGDFVTETGRHLKDMEYQVWNAGEPNNYDGVSRENCLALSGRGYYNDVRCDLALPFICEIAPV